MAFLKHVESTYVKQALSQPAWHQAMQLKYYALMANPTYTQTTLPPYINLVV